MIIPLGDIWDTTLLSWLYDWLFGTATSVAQAIWVHIVWVMHTLSGWVWDVLNPLELVDTLFVRMPVRMLGFVIGLMPSEVQTALGAVVAVWEVLTAIVSVVLFFL